MKMFFSLICSLNFVFFAFAQGSLNQSFEYLEKAPENTIVDAILFSINGTPYSLIDLKKYMFLSGIKNPKIACFNYIQTLLIVEKAKSLGAKVPEKVINRAIEEILNRNHMNLSTLNILLQSKDISFEEFKKFVENQILVSGYLQDFGKPDLLVLAQDFNLEIYEPLCYTDELKDFYVPKFNKNLKIIKNQNSQKNINITKDNEKIISNSTLGENINGTEKK